MKCEECPFWTCINSFVSGDDIYICLLQPEEGDGYECLDEHGDRAGEEECELPYCINDVMYFQNLIADLNKAVKKVRKARVRQ